MRSDLKAYALRLTESDDNAEDLVQEVMLRLWDMRQNIKAENNLKALAITIMRNKFYDQCRHEERNFTTDKVMEVPIEDRRAEQRDEVNLIKQIVAHDDVKRLASCSRSSRCATCLEYIGTGIVAQPIDYRLVSSNKTTDGSQ